MSKLLITIVLLFILLLPAAGKADRADELKNKINEKAAEIEKLESEIKEYEGKIKEVEKESKTLTGAISTLDITRKKLQTDIRVTETRIDNTSLNIEKLQIDIGDKQSQISANKSSIAETIRLLREAESNSLVEILFLHDSLSEFWSNIDNLQSLQNSITFNLAEIKDRKEELLSTKKEAETYRNNLVDLGDKLVDQKSVTDITRNEKSNLLVQTKNKQSEYEKLLSEKMSRKLAFEQEIFEYEAALKEVLDPSTVPDARHGVLRWPVDNVRITQYFGYTSFAKNNPQIYKGKGHNGIDLGVPIGTPVYAARGGTVLGSGNTDDACKNASYGKWVLIEHDNGLYTLYAHLSLIKGTAGQAVSKGGIIGYSGNTGSSTGPHLHFMVIAPNSIKIGKLTSRVCSNAVYTIPLLTKTGGYLDPIDYLPKL